MANGSFSIFQESQGPVVEGAGFWIRALARLVDALFGWYLAYVIALFGGTVLGSLARSQVISYQWILDIHEHRYLFVIMSAIGAFSYHSLSEGMAGTTVGKFLCRLRVLSEDLTQCTLKAAFKRTLAYYLDALFCGLVGYHAMQQSLKKQRYGDRWAATIVLPSKVAVQYSRREGWKVLVGILVGAVCWFLFLLIPYVAYVIASAR